MADSFLPLLLFQRIQKRTPERCLGKLRGRDRGFGGRQWRCRRSYDALFFRLADSEEKTLVLFFSAKTNSESSLFVFSQDSYSLLEIFPRRRTTTFPGRRPLQHWWWWCVVLFLLFPLSLPFSPPAPTDGKRTDTATKKRASPPRLVSKPTEHLRKPSSASPPPLRKGYDDEVLRHQ